MSILVGIVNGKAPSGGVGGVSDADLMNLGVNFLRPGAVSSTALQVQQQGTANNTVKVKTGTYYALNASGTMLYPVTIDADVTPVTITNNPSGNPLIGSVVLKLDLGVTPNNLASNIGTIVYVAGTPAASPTAPSDSALQSAVGSGNVFAHLADIDVVAGFTAAMAIDSSMIHDKRTVSGMKLGVQRQGGSATDFATPGANNYIANDCIVQCGAATGLSGGGKTVTFPVAFSAKPSVVATRVSDSGASAFNTVEIENVTASTFVFHVYDNANTRIAGPINWIAVGPRA